jgi:predicted DCC family thiol-disulfide oxidoreductase YuxK
LEKPIIVFDGLCNFCSRTVDVIIRADANDNFLFVASQSPAGIKLLQQYRIHDIESVCLIYEGKVIVKSEAALTIARKLAIPWQWFVLLKIVPRGWRDAVYSFIAARRYRWFGKRESCKVPDEKYKAKFIE